MFEGCSSSQEYLNLCPNGLGVLSMTKLSLFLLQDFKINSFCTPKKSYRPQCYISLCVQKKEREKFKLYNNSIGEAQKNFWVFMKYILSTIATKPFTPHWWNCIALHYLIESLLIWSFVRSFFGTFVRFISFSICRFYHLGLFRIQFNYQLLIVMSFRVPLLLFFVLFCWTRVKRRSVPF